MIDLALIADRYVSRCAYGDIVDLAMSHGLDIVHRVEADALLIDDTIFVNVCAPTIVMRANVALCCAFQCMRATRMERDEAVAEQLAALILERTQQRKAA